MGAAPALIKSYKDLIVWQKAIDLVTDIYRATERFPKEEIYGLRSQIRRAAVSIPSNIAEGHGRNSGGEYRQFVGHALGSICELETQLQIASNLSLISNAASKSLMAKVAEVGRMLTALRQALN